MILTLVRHGVCGGVPAAVADLDCATINALAKRLMSHERNDYALRAWSGWVGAQGTVESMKAWTDKLTRTEPKGERDLIKRLGNKGGI